MEYDHSVVVVVVLIIAIIVSVVAVSLRQRLERISKRGFQSGNERFYCIQMRDNEEPKRLKGEKKRERDDFSP